MELRKTLVTTLVLVSKESLWVSCPGIAFALSGKNLCHSNICSFRLYWWKLMTRQVSATGEIGGTGDASLSSWTCSGKGKQIGFGYLFVDDKNYSRSPTRLKHSLSPSLVNDELKGLVHLPISGTLAPCFTLNKRCQNFMSEHGMVRHKTGGKPLTSIEFGIGITGDWLWPPLTYTKANNTFYSIQANLADLVCPSEVNAQI